MIVPYLNMSARVVVGRVTFDHVESIHIEESVLELGDTAVVTLPRNYKRLNGRPVLDYIKAGDPVKIYAGYNGKLELEFEGYLKNAGSEIPLVLECDDQFYPLKQNSWTKSYSSVTLKSLLAEIVTGYQVECPDMTLHKFQLDHASTYQVLRELQKDYGLFSRIINGTLVLGFSWEWDFEKTKRHIYHR